MTTQTNNPNAQVQERIRQLREKIYTRKHGNPDKKDNNEFQVKKYESCTIWVKVR